MRAECQTGEKNILRRKITQKVTAYVVQNYKAPLKYVRQTVVFGGFKIQFYHCLELFRMK